MTQTISPAAPEAAPSRTGRIDGIDVARAVAVLGMFAAHFNPGQLDPDDLVRTVVAGRSAVLFVVLAGISVALATGTGRGRRPRPGARAGLIARAVTVFALGLALSALGTTVKEILTVYGVLFVLAVPLLRLPARALLALAAGGAVVGPVVSFLLRRGPLASGVAGRTPDPSGLLDPGAALDTVRGLLLDGPYPVLTWLPFLLVGMALARADLGDPAVARRLVVIGLPTAAVALTASWLATGPLGGLRAVAAATGADPARVHVAAASPVGAVPVDHPAYLLISSPHSGSPFEIVASTGLAVAVLGVCLLLAGRFRTALAPLRATGRLALSAYACHVLLIAAVGLPGMVALLTDHGYGLLVLLLVTTPLIALGWVSWLGRGPLERVVAAVARTAARAVVRPVAPDRPGPDGR